MDSDLDLTGKALDVLGEQIARMWLLSYYEQNSLVDEEEGEEDIHDDLYDY
jgi:hypothetical protein